jgi:hypothetical protein
MMVDPDGLPRLAGEVALPFKSALAFSSRAISASIVWIISVVSIQEIIGAAGTATARSPRVSEDKSGLRRI